MPVGQKVFTRLPTKQIGAFAEYVAVPEDAVALMPKNLSFEEAAAIPLTALTAFQALELMQPQSGQSIFISGGSGRLGVMAHSSRKDTRTCDLHQWQCSEQRARDGLGCRQISGLSHRRRPRTFAQGRLCARQFGR